MFVPVETRLYQLLLHRWVTFDNPRDFWRAIPSIRLL